MRAIREHYPDIQLMVDANIAVFSRMRGDKFSERLAVQDSNTPHLCDYRYSAYTLADTPLFQELDVFNLLMIEQPLAHDDIIDHA